MAIPSPLRQTWIDLGASLLLYGPPELGVELTETLGDIEREYAAIRKACVLMDRPDRAVVRITGDDRIELLNRMLTQELKDVPTGSVRRSFWLNRKGRIVADVRLLVADDHILVDLDAHSVGTFVESLDAFIIADDVILTDATGDYHRLTLAGPTAADLLGEVTAGAAMPEVDHAVATTIAGVAVHIDRWDWTAAPGFELWCPADGAPAVADALLAARVDPEAEIPSELAQRIKLRPAGWFAMNIARVEAGTPLMHLDFTNESLPAETGVLHDRVDFKKGCYLGQEVVARMDSLGHPKQTLAALRLTGQAMRDEDGQPRQPVGGAPILDAPATDAKQVGAVTSSVVSPMLGAEPIALAVVRWGSHEPGKTLHVIAEGVAVEATVQEHLAFWTPA